MLEESVIYQDIFQKGEQKGLQKGIQRGLQEGAEQEARKLAILMLEQRLGKVSRSMQQQIERLEVEQLEALCASLLEFRSKEKLARWLKKHAPKRGNGA